MAAPILNGLKLGTGPTRVWLHGLLSSHLEFKYFAKKIGGTQVLLDARNHGSSFSSPDMRASSMARDVINYLDSNQIHRCSLVGFSMGALTAMQIACSFPDRIEKLVALDVLPVDYRSAFPEFTSQLIELVSPMQLRLISTISLQRTTKEEVLRKLESAVPERYYFDLLTKNLEETETGLNWKVAVDSLFQGYDTLKDNQIQGRFNGPSLMLLGKESDLTVKRLPNLGRAEDLFKKNFNDFSVEYIEEASHTIHLQKPRQVLKLISDFLLN